MRNTILISILLIISIFLFYCSEDKMISHQDNIVISKTYNSDFQTYQNALENNDMETVNEIRLKHFAKTIAKAVSNEKVSRLLKEEISKKIGGDYDALWENIKNISISYSMSFRDLLEDILYEEINSFLYMEEIEKVPLLQISLPYGFDNWDGESSIKISYTVLSKNDIDVEKLFAYDSEGNEYILDAKTPPNFPILVVGKNERINYLQETSLEKTTAIERESEEILYRIKIYDDKEPWWKGDPEVYIVAAGTKSSYNMKNKVNLPGVNEEDHWYYPDVILFDWNKSYWGDNTGYGVFEYDPDSYNYKITITEENVKVKVENKDNDDLIGNIVSIPWDHSTTYDYGFDDVKMRLWYEEH